MTFRSKTQVHFCKKSVVTSQAHHGGMERDIEKSRRIGWAQRSDLYPSENHMFLSCTGNEISWILCEIFNGTKLQYNAEFKLRSLESRDTAAVCCGAHISLVPSDWNPNPQIQIGNSSCESWEAKPKCLMLYTISLSRLPVYDYNN